MATPVLERVRPTFRALAVTVVPDAASLDGAEWAELEAIVEEALLARPSRLRRQVGLLIRALDLLPLLWWRRRFRSLDPGRRARLLSRLQDAPVLLLRRGIWGLRTLVLMGYYGRPAAAARIGYSVPMQGWRR